MTIEERRMVDNEANDGFPMGMRVLAVDDDHICLRVLERLLRQCNYHVTTTTQAVTALKMLRENRNNFDLVISDVHMPDMDGFKLLEQVGLEMDLPVIMLSGNGDTRNVMKGITHGACDYLLKPVRIEELKNIWQHVIRKKKLGPNNSDNSDKPGQGTSEGGQASSAPGLNDRKLNKKRKDQDEDEDEDDDYDESGQENEDPSAQKKPRVVWSVELHRKFVSAVNQLGIDKAVPKKILDLMNVERLTRENVASHLQKYRLYLKRISSVASQQANMVAALGGKDAAYLHGMNEFHALTGSGQLPGAAFPPYSSAAMLGRLNTPTALGGFRGLTPSGMIQLGHTPNSNNAFNDIGRLQSAMLPGNQNVNLLQNKFINRPGEFPPIGDQISFPLSSSGFPDAGVTIGNSSNSFTNASNNRMLLANLQQVQNQGGLGNQSSITMPPNNSERFDIGAGLTTHLSDITKAPDTWQGAVPLTGFSNPLPMSDPFSPADLAPSNVRDNITSIASNMRNNSMSAASNNVVSSALHDSRRDVQVQGGSVGITIPHDNPRPSTFGSISNRVNPNGNYPMQPNREENRRDQMHNPNLLINPVNSSLPMHNTMGSLGQNLAQENALSNRRMDSPMLTPSGTSNPFVMQQNGFESSPMESPMRFRGDYQMEQARPQGGFANNGSGSSSGSGSLEDLMNAMIKREQLDVMLMDGDIGCNGYPVRTCI